MNIKQVEELTGITKQNIRFYEKEGLITPKRNDGNGYREYDTEDIHSLLVIKMLRKLGMPLDEIGRVLKGECDLVTAVQRQRESLEEEKNRLDAAIRICRELETEMPETLDIERTLERIEAEESAGNRFADIWNDYRMVAAAEEKKRFNFMPDIYIKTPRDFTDALLQYAKENDEDITVTKEGMYPEFIMNGLEYSAYRRGTRFGMAVYCEMIHPEEADPEGMPEGRLKKMKMVHLVLQILLVLVVMGVPFLLLDGGSIWAKIFLVIGMGIAGAAVYNSTYRGFRG